MTIESCKVQLYMSLLTSDTQISFTHQMSGKNIKVKKFSSGTADDINSPHNDSAKLKRFNNKENDKNNSRLDRHTKNNQPNSATNKKEEKIDEKKEDLTDLIAKIKRFMKDNQKTTEEAIYEKF